MVILPEGLAAAIGPAALGYVLIHECAHIARRDLLIGLVQRVVELVYWPHPLIHIMNRRLSRTREEACDDVVLSHGDPIAYAGTLLTLAERFESPRRPREALALMTPRWRLEDRVAGLLNPARRTRVRPDRRGLAAAAVVLALAGVAAAGVQWTQSPAPQPAAAQAAPGRAGWSIPGVVVDAAGKPVAVASVRLLGSSGEPAEAVSGSDGAFVIHSPGPMQDRSELVASVDEGRLQGLGTFVESNDSKVPSAPARIALAPSRTVEVTVRGGQGKPVAKAVVEVIAQPADVATARTDASGRAVVRYPASARVQAVVALKSARGWIITRTTDRTRSTLTPRTCPEQSP